MKKINLIGSIILTSLISAQAYAWTTSQEAASRLGATEVREISFTKNSAKMSSEQKTEIRNAVNEVAQKNKIDKVQILVWSDKEYPSEKNNQSKLDVKLAQDRIKDLKSFMNKDLKISKIDSFNMTERPNALQKFFNTEQDKTKNTMQSAGAAPLESQTGLFDLQAQASKGVIMIFIRK